MTLLLIMIALTAYSQYNIIPAMERDRTAAAGGVIDSLAPTDPARLDFDRLHQRSTSVEGAVVLLGIAVVVLVAGAEQAAARRV
jgi:hypothetical protein